MQWIPCPFETGDGAMDEATTTLAPMCLPTGGYVEGCSRQLVGAWVEGRYTNVMPLVFVVVCCVAFLWVRQPKSVRGGLTYVVVREASRSGQPAPHSLASQRKGTA